MEIVVKLLNTDDIDFLPSRHYRDNAGADLRARINTNLWIEPGQTKKIPLGVAMAIPCGYVGDVRPRSGATLESKVAMYGTIDSNYRGEIHAILLNTSKSDVLIKPKERIAQIVILPCPPVEFKPVKQLGTTDRGENGFGSSGVE